MAVSVTTRPSTWSAVKNPVVYKFTSTGHGALTNYRIQVEVFKASDNTSLTGGVTFSFSPDSSGISYADVSSIIKAYLVPDWIDPSAINEVETDTFLKFYIKYQELYDGSATSVVDDVANPRYAVFAGLQIPSTNGNNMTDYVPASATKQFLTLFDNPKIWHDYPSTLSFIYPDALSLLYLLRRQYDDSGSLLNETYSLINVSNDDAVNRIDLLSGITLLSAKDLRVKLIANGSAGSELLTNPSFTATLSPWVNTGLGGTQTWIWDAGNQAQVSISSGTPQSDILRQSITLQTAGFYRIVLNGNQAAGFTTRIQVKGFLGEVEQVIFTSENVTTFSWSVTVNNYLTHASFDRIQIDAAWIAGAGTNPFNITDVSFSRTADDSFTEELIFGVQEPCDNPVLLVWKNSLGGDAWWLFDGGQESGYNFSGSKKAKRMTLFAEHLTLDQWEALNELNTLGEVYQENIIELTSSVNKTAVRDGAQVYVVDADGTKTGVIVIPSTSVINTRDVTHSIEIEIEFPERVE